MMGVKNSRQYFPIFAFAALVAVSFFVLAATAHADNPGQGPYGNTTVTPTFVPLADYSKSTQFSNIFASNSLSGYINAIFTTLLSVGAILAVLRIAYAGYLYMGSADMWGNKQQAREMLGDAIIGLLLLFGIYLILYQINPNLLNLNILNDIQPAQTTTSASPTSSGGATSDNAASITQQAANYQYDAAQAGFGN
jgi:hypothetical protein